MAGAADILMEEWHNPEPGPEPIRCRYAVVIHPLYDAFAIHMNRVYPEGYVLERDLRWLPESWVVV